MTKCPHCEQKLVLPTGPEDAPWLLVGDQPGVDEISTGRPFSGHTGDVLRNELLRLDLTIHKFRLANLWLHEINDDPVDWHLEQLLTEMQNKTHVLLMGAKVSMAVAFAGVRDYSGLKVKSRLLPRSVKVCIISPNPAIVFQPNGMTGELRLALKNFVESLK